HLLSCCAVLSHSSVPFFLFPASSPTEIYTLSLHDALPICYIRPFFETVTTTGYAFLSVMNRSLHTALKNLHQWRWPTITSAEMRSEERRVGKEWRGGGAPSDWT